LNIIISLKKMHDARTRRCVPDDRQRVLRKADAGRRLAATCYERFGTNAGNRMDRLMMSSSP